MVFFLMCLYQQVWSVQNLVALLSLHLFAHYLSMFLSSNQAWAAKTCNWHLLTIRLSKTRSNYQIHSSHLQPFFLIRKYACSVLSWDQSRCVMIYTRVTTLNPFFSYCLWFSWHRLEPMTSALFTLTLSQQRDWIHQPELSSQLRDGSFARWIVLAPVSVRLKPRWASIWYAA